MPNAETTPFLSGHDDVLKNVKAIIRAAVGGSLNKLYVEKDVVKESMAIRYIGSMVPVVILNADDVESYDLGRTFNRGSVPVELAATDVIDKDFLIKTFKEVNKKIKQKKNAPEIQEVAQTAPAPVTDTTIEE